ncbi:anti-phage ZorAB system protein ZorA [Dechloromonas denitrificans]|uniref:anti-phage ZorAB system protein ZorA n=1 Tax=Dechloromonas denitrificans TaxID=281362 RepID=UPI001CF8BEFF|nr:anti-phage ZorAB system protein ZorA [Dechloromonas denitrificans]UCV01710.1 anti-phage defense ZorAB system ZorA [Dechloromonas denitrificans]
MASLLQFWHVWSGWIVAAVLLAITLGFLLRFVLPALVLGQELAKAIKGLAAQSLPADPERIGREVMDSPRLRHLWREYTQTLHAIADPATPKAVAAWRATAMAEDFLTERALVDTPLKTDFYKHLPGILTGIGIIGTFTGLIAGLNHFEVSSNAELVRTSLRSLIQGVGQAFEVSAAAITLAMLVTWIEKSIVTRRYRQVETLVQRIDSLFDAGVGEEYLARLVRASEASAVQAGRLQQAIVGELRQGMAAMLAQQQQATLQHQEALASKVADAVAKTVASALHEPLARMTTAVERLGAGQGQAVGGALEKALNQFSGRLDDTFGQRQDGLESLLQRTANALEATVGELGKVAGRLELAGRGAVESAAGRLDNAGRGVGEAAEFFALSSGDMAASAAAMSQAANSVGQSLSDQRQLTASIALMVGDLRATIEHARREAALTGELVGRMEGAAATLGRAGHDADTYLQGISDVLAQAHAAFAENVERTLARGNGQFQQHVTGAVEALKGAIEELADALAQEPVRR